MRESQSLEAWRAAVSRRCEHVRTEGRGLRFAPCPACGGGSRDSAWARQGRAGIVAGCNGGCTFEALARALWPTERPRPRPDGPGTAPRRLEARSVRFGGPDPAETVNTGDPGGKNAVGSPVRPERDPRRGRGTPGFRAPMKDHAAPMNARRPDFAALAEAVEASGPVHPAARAWIEARALDPDRLEAAGWRSMTGPDLDAMARQHGAAIPRAAVAAALVLAVPLHDPDGRALSVRVRPIDPPGPTLTLPGDVGRLYGLASTGAGDVLHVAEGETDAQSLVEAGAGAVIGLPGAGALHGAAMDAARAMDARRVALWLDGDPAGRLAAERLAGSLTGAGVSAWRWRYPPGRDVNDHWRADPDGLRLAVATMEADA